MRKKKSLLSEAQVRRFQSLASIQPIHGMKSRRNLREQDEFEMEDEEADLGGDEAPEGMEMGPEEPEGGEMGEADVELDEELVEKFIEAASTIQQVADSLGGEAGAEMDMGAEEPMDMGGDDLELDAGEEEGGEELEMDAGEEEEDEEAIMEALKGISYVPSQKEVVKVVAKRVARRLQEAKIAQRRLNRALGKK